MSKRSQNVAVLGLGNMGKIITRNLAFKSRSAFYLQLHSRNIERARRMSDTLWQDGAQCAIRLHNRYDTLAKWSDIIVVCLPNSEVARKVFLSPDDGILNYLREGQIILDHTTNDVATSRELHERIAEKQAAYLDAPMSGNVLAAKNGSLTIMVGGDEQTYLKILPLMRLYGENIQHMGEPTSGTAAKLICQQLVAIHTVAAAEAMTLAHTFGITNHQKLISALDSSWGSSTMLRRNAPITERILRNPNEPPPDSRNTIHALAIDVARVMEANNTLPLTSLTHDILVKADAGGSNTSDMGAVVHYLDAAAYPPKSDVAPFDAKVLRKLGKAKKPLYGKVKIHKRRKPKPDSTAPVEAY